jgi:hypothetical protein
MNAIMERWIKTCRRELLDHTLIWNQQHLLHTLQEYEQFTTPTDPTRASPTPDHYTRSHSRPRTKPRTPISTSADTNDWAASSTSTTTQPDQHGRSFRQAHRWTSSQRVTSDWLTSGSRDTGCPALSRAYTGYGSASSSASRGNSASSVRS